MKDRGFNPEALDLQAFCKQGGTVSGDVPLARMARLCEGFSAVSDSSATWTAAGSLRSVTGGAAGTWLHLSAHADVPLQCQRCLQTMTQSLDVDRHFRFVRSEDEAAALDEEAEEDVLLLPARLDLMALLEDELILALPIVPRHDVCPDPLPLPPEDPAEAADAPHPFAGLAALRKHSRDTD